MLQNQTDFVKSLIKKAKRYVRKSILDDGLDNGNYQPAPALSVTDILHASQGLGSILKYDVYDPSNGLFFNDDTIGFMFELTPQTGANDEMEKRLQTLYTSAPAKTGIQIVLTGMPDVEPLLERYVEMRKQGFDRDEVNAKLHVELAKNHVAHIRQGALAPMWQGDPFTIKNFRVLFSVVMPGTTDDVETIHRLQTLRESYRQSLRTAGFPSVDMDADDFVNWLYPIVNAEKMLSGEERAPLNYDKGRSIKGQIREHGLIKQRYDKLIFSGKEEIEVRAYSVLSYPRAMELFEMGGLIGDFFDVGMQYPCPFMITLGVHTLEFDAVKNKSMLKAARAQQNAESPMAKFQPELQEQQKDWKVVSYRLDEGHTMCEFYHQLVLFCPKERMEAAESSAMAIWRSRGFTIVRDYFTSLASFYVALPMTLSPAVRDDLKTLERISTKTTDNAINLPPMIAEWKGAGDEVMMFVGRRGQPAFLDFFANTAGNFNVAITGVPGSGKSVTMQYIMQSYRSVGAKGWIIDVGRSYEKIVDVNGGQFIEFRTDAPICINPFSWVTNITEDMRLLKPWAARMAQAQGPYAMSLIERAVGACYEEHRELTTITHVQKYLMEKCLAFDHKIDEEAYRLGIQMTPFCKGGMYADFFNGRATVSMKADLVALEMEELKGSPELLQAVLFVVMNRITYEMYLSRTTRKIAILDEAWSLLGDDSESAKFIEEGYRRARKYDGSFITGTQGVGDYFQNPASRAAYAFADWKLYLRQDDDTLKELKQKGQLNLDPSLERMIASLATESGKFSELVVRSPMGSGLVRLVLDPFFLEMASTKAADFNAFRALKDQGMETTEAIYHMMRAKGYQRGGYRHAA
ncbi:MAG: type IV secretion system protein TraC [Ottowia sp.]|nr:type IV secretion system protein TraC [Ottowia sp.]